MTTTVDLDYLLMLKLPTITPDDMSPVVRLADVPAGLRSALIQNVVEFSLRTLFVRAISHSKLATMPN